MKKISEKDLDDLIHRFSDQPLLLRKFTIWRKIAFWNFAIAFALFSKRSLDISLSLIGLFVTFPLLALAAIGIKISDSGPIFFVDERVGLHGQRFKCYKLRTMYLNSHNEKVTLKDKSIHKGDITFKMKNDPRITKIGRFLRKTSIDELPQLWCVLEGSMSIVGPRPPLPSEVAKYSNEERKRLEIKPGITCMWQVSGRSDLPFHKQLELDKEYIASSSFWLDVKLILMTIPAVLTGRGAY